MPSFFEGMKRMWQGKPIYDPGDQQPPNPDVPAAPALGFGVPMARPGSATPQTPGSPAPAQPVRPLIHKEDSRTFPTVYIRRTVTHVNNGQMEVRSRILNSSPMDIEVESARLLGTEVRLKCGLRPNEEREFLLYRGPCLPNTQYHDVKLDYKTHEGDYFEAYHDVRFTYQPDHTYSVDEIRLHPPIRDIYG